MRRHKTIGLGRPGLALLAAALLCGPALAEEPKESPFVTAAKSLTLSGYAQILAVEWDRGVDTFSLRRARIGLSIPAWRHESHKLRWPHCYFPCRLQPR